MELLGEFEIRYYSVELDPALPIRGGQPYVQSDEPIRWLHYHQCLELGLCLEGSGIFVVGEKVHSFTAGDAIFINHTEVHLAQSAPGTVSRWFWIYLDPLRLVPMGMALQSLVDPTPLAGPNFDNILRPDEDPEIGRLLEKMAVELQSQPESYGECLQAMALEFMTRLRRIRPVPEGEGSRRRDLERIAPALQMIARNYARPVNLEPLAQSCNVSEPSLRRLFQQAVGRSPRDYWLDMRLRMAASMLRTSSKTVLEISQEVGFPTLSSFNRLFRDKYGVAPTGWRGRE